MMTGRVILQGLCAGLAVLCLVTAGVWWAWGWWPSAVGCLGLGIALVVWAGIEAVEEELDVPARLFQKVGPVIRAARAVTAEFRATGSPNGSLSGLCRAVEALDQEERSIAHARRDAT